MKTFAYTSIIADVSMMLAALITCKLLFSLIMVFYHSTNNHKQGRERKRETSKQPVGFYIVKYFFSLKMFLASEGTRKLFSISVLAGVKTGKDFSRHALTYSCFLGLLD